MQLHYPLNPTTGVEDQTQLPWTNGVPQTSTEGSFPPALAVVEPMTELMNLLGWAGIIGSGTDLNQVTRAVRGGQLDFDATDSSTTGDQITCQIGLPHTQIMAGLPFTFIKGPSANTGNAVPTLTITDLNGNNGLTGTLVKSGGGALAKGDLPANALITVRARAPGVFSIVSMVLISDVLALIASYQRPVTPYTGTVTGGGFYAMDLGSQQVFNLPNPATLTSGWYTDLLVTGIPSGIQTAYAQIAAGAGSTNLTYRGQSSSPFYLIGGGEILRFLWTGSLFLIEVLCQPNQSLLMYETYPGGPSSQGGSGSLAYLPINSVSGNPQLFQRSTTVASCNVPVSGFYSIVASTGINGTSSTYQGATLYLADGTALTNIYDATTSYSNNVAPSTLKCSAQVLLKQGSQVNVFINAPSGMNFNPSTDTFNISLVNR